MKCLYLLLIIVAIISDYCFPQSFLYSGLFSVSGSASFSYSHSNPDYFVDITEKEISISPTISYFIINNLSAGIEVAYNFYQKAYDSDNYIEDINMYLSIGPVIKYYFIDDKIAPFVKVAYLQSIYNEIESVYHSRESFPGFTVKGGFGLNYFFIKSFSVETSIDYSYTQNKIEIYPEGGSPFSDSYRESIKLSIGMLYFF